MRSLRIDADVLVHIHGSCIPFRCLCTLYTMIACRHMGVRWVFTVSLCDCSRRRPLFIYRPDTHVIDTPTQARLGEGLSMARCFFKPSSVRTMALAYREIILNRLTSACTKNTLASTERQIALSISTKAKHPALRSLRRTSGLQQSLHNNTSHFSAQGI